MSKAGKVLIGVSLTLVFLISWVESNHTDSTDNIVTSISIEDLNNYEEVYIDALCYDAEYKTDTRADAKSSAIEFADAKLVGYTSNWTGRIYSVKKDYAWLSLDITDKNDAPQIKVYGLTDVRQGDVVTIDIEVTEVRFNSGYAIKGQLLKLY